MRCLVGVVVCGGAKNYVLPKFQEMARACILPNEDVDMMVASDWLHDAHMPMGQHGYVEDMLMDAREQFREYAIKHGYDKLCYQGVDCLWQDREQFRHVMEHDVPCVSALTCSRQWAHEAVARRFQREILNSDYGDGPGGTLPVYGQYLEEQYDIPKEELLGGGLVESGFPGADAIFFDRSTFDVSFSSSHHKKWYVRVAEGLPNLDCMEFTCLQLLRRDQGCYVDTDVKVWHVHEDGMAHMYPDLDVPLGELRWR